MPCCHRRRASRSSEEEHPDRVRRSAAPLRWAVLGGSVDARRRTCVLHALFTVGVVAKGIDGTLEIIGGILALAISRAQLHPIVRLLTQHELAEDPHDIVANFLLRSSQHLSASAKLFGAIYLLVHGSIKVGLVTALLRKARWAYPTAILAFVVFLVYEAYRYLLTGAPGLLALSVLDVLVIVLTWAEYRRVRDAHVRA
jgi:uncharacterized membrane protein